ncbi:hypothetical protein BDP27DRAFT_1236193, partial [Rhodocollybia butyracea]
VMTCQAMNFRSLQCSQLQYLLGMYASSTGTSVRTIQVLDAAGLSVSHPTILKTINTIADQVVNLARELTFEPHNFTYDNIDMSGSIHVEQTKDAVAKVRSGCFCLIYHTVGVKDRKHMLLAPILQNLQKAIPLDAFDIQPTQIQIKCFQHQSITNIILSLACQSKPFHYLKQHPDLQHKPCRLLPPNTKTVFYPLCVTSKEEKTVQGNLDNHNDFYIHQMRRNAKDPDDVNAYTQHLIFQLGLALFYMLMNLIWDLRLKQYGDLKSMGSLVYFFTLMEKKRLAGEKPDFWALSAALLQILDGIFLAAWKKECGFPSLEAFAASDPQPIQLKAIAAHISRKYCTPMLKAKSKPTSEPSSPDDVCHCNLCLFLPVVAEVTAAIPRGDFGRIEDLLSSLTCEQMDTRNSMRPSHHSTSGTRSSGEMGLLSIQDQLLRKRRMNCLQCSGEMTMRQINKDCNSN